MKRKLSQQQSEERSMITSSVQPWLNSTGPKTLRGKLSSRKNSRKHGYNAQTLKDFRKLNRRGNELRQFEALCRQLNSTTVNNDKVEEIESTLSQLFQKFNKLYLTYEGNNLNQDLILESTYVIKLMANTVNYSLFVSYRKYKKNSQEILNQMKGLEKRSRCF